MSGLLECSTLGPWGLLHLAQGAVPRSGGGCARGVTGRGLRPRVLLPRRSLGILWSAGPNVRHRQGPARPLENGRDIARKRLLLSLRGLPRAGVPLALRVLAAA